MSKKQLPVIQVFDPEKLRKRRQSRGLSVTALAELAGVSRVSASLWESGVVIPNFESIQRLAHGLGLKRIEPLLKDKDAE